MKKDFPIFKNKINGKKLIYLDSAATSQKPQVVIDAILEFYKTYNANVKRGLYPIAEKATEKIGKVRQEVAKFINAKYPEEIIFVRNTTEAINLVAYLVSHNIKREEGIITSTMEHHSNFVPWQQLALKKNADFLVLDIDENGFLDLDSGIKNYELRIKSAKIFAVAHVSNVLGTINPIKDIIKKVKEINPNILVLVDAAQSVPHLKVDVQDLGCDFLAFSGHKMMAGTGIGVLYGKKHLLNNMQPFMFGGEMIREVNIENTTFADLPHKYEAGTPDIAGIVSLGAAIEYLNSTGIENIQKHDNRLIKYALQKMEKIEGINIYGPRDLDRRSGVISFNINGVHPHDIAQVLGNMGICIRAGHHCAMPLHKRLGIPASARASFYLYNDEEDVDYLIKGIKEVKNIFSLI